VILSESFILWILEAKRAQFNDLISPLQVGLFANNITPTPATPLVSFLAPTFVGYAAQPCGTWGAAIINADGDGEISADPLTYTPTSIGAAEDIYGWVAWLGTEVVCSERFPGGPYPMGGTLDDLTVYPILKERSF
jgi:hypothetical protein